VIAKVLNIIAELKPGHRTDVIAMLRTYGFRCMKYVEAYDLVLPSDRYLELRDGKMAIDQRLTAESPPSMAYYGIRCDESHPTSDHLDRTEVFMY
jgi:hypothetical protein